MSHLIRTVPKKHEGQYNFYLDSARLHSYTLPPVGTTYENVKKMQLRSTAGMVSRNIGARKQIFIQTWSTENNLLIGNQISCKEKDTGQSRKATKTMHGVSTLSCGCSYIKISHIFYIKAKV